MQLIDDYTHIAKDAIISNLPPLAQAPPGFKI